MIIIEMKNAKKILKIFFTKSIFVAIKIINVNRKSLSVFIQRN
jgi:hypothetical protein